MSNTENNPANKALKRVRKNAAHRLADMLAAREAIDKEIEAEVAEMGPDVPVVADERPDPEPAQQPAQQSAPDNEAAAGATRPTMADVQAQGNIPSPNGVAEVLQGKAPLSSIIPPSYQDKTTPKAGCFSLESGEKIQAYLKDITRAFGEMVPHLAFADSISRDVNAPAMQSIVAFGARTKELMDLVDPAIEDDGFVEDKVVTENTDDNK